MKKSVVVGIGIAVAAVIAGAVFGLTMLPSEEMEETVVVESELETEVEPVGKNISVVLTEEVGVAESP